jgi:hypothetical protein
MPQVGTSFHPVWQVPGGEVVVDVAGGGEATTVGESGGGIASPEATPAGAGAAGDGDALAAAGGRAC